MTHVSNQAFLTSKEVFCTKAMKKSSLKLVADWCCLEITFLKFLKSHSNVPSTYKLLGNLSLKKCSIEI